MDATMPINGSAVFGAKQVEDWCHLCGKRTKPLAEAWFPENAEHETKQTEYIRVCGECVRIMGALTGDRQAPELSAAG